jgi:hypothetical protein
MGKLMVGVARFLPLCALLLLSAITKAKHRLQIPLVQALQDVAYRRMRRLPLPAGCCEHPAGAKRREPMTHEVINARSSGAPL